MLKMYLGKGSKKKSGNFSKGGGPSELGSISHFFQFFFKNGLNHPEMQRNIFSPLSDPPPSPQFETISFFMLKPSLKLEFCGKKLSTKEGNKILNTFKKPYMKFKKNIYSHFLEGGARALPKSGKMSNFFFSFLTLPLICRYLMFNLPLKFYIFYKEICHIFFLRQICHCLQFLQTHSTSWSLTFSEF